MSWSDMTDGPTFYRRTVMKGGTIRAQGIVFTSPALEPYVGQRVMVVDGFPEMIEIRVYRPQFPVGRRTGEPLLSVTFGCSGRVKYASGRRTPPIEGVQYPAPFVAVDVAYRGQEIRTLFDCKYRPMTQSEGGAN